MNCNNDTIDNLRTNRTILSSLYFGGSMSLFVRDKVLPKVTSKFLKGKFTFFYFILS